MTKSKVMEFSHGQMGVSTKDITKTILERALENWSIQTVQFTEEIGQQTNKSMLLRNLLSTMKIVNSSFLLKDTFQTLKLEKSSTTFILITNRVISLNLSHYTMSHNPQLSSNRLLVTSGPEVWPKVAKEQSKVLEGKARSVSLVEWQKRCQSAQWQASRILIATPISRCWLLHSFIINSRGEKRKEVDSKFQGDRLRLVESQEADKPMLTKSWNTLPEVKSAVLLNYSEFDH